MNNLVDFFPSNYSPRQTQIGALKQIQEAIEQNYKYIICSLPTGSGKSFIPSTLCNYSRAPTKEFIKLITENWGIVDGVPNDGTSQSSFGVMALTVTKTLQDQYKDLFENEESEYWTGDSDCSMFNNLIFKLFISVENFSFP